MFKVNLAMMNKLEFVQLGNEWKIKIDYSNIQATDPRYFTVSSHEKYYSKTDCIEALEAELSYFNEFDCCTPYIVKFGNDYYWIHIVSPSIVYEENMAFLNFKKYGSNELIYLDCEKEFYTKSDFDKFYEKLCENDSTRYIHV